MITFSQWLINEGMISDKRNQFISQHPDKQQQIIKLFDKFSTLSKLNRLHKTDEFHNIAKTYETFKQAMDNYDDDELISIDTADKYLPKLLIDETDLWKIYHITGPNACIELARHKFIPWCINSSSNGAKWFKNEILDKHLQIYIAVLKMPSREVIAKGMSDRILVAITTDGCGNIKDVYNSYNTKQNPKQFLADNKIPTTHLR